MESQSIVNGNPHMTYGGPSNDPDVGVYVVPPMLTST